MKSIVPNTTDEVYDALDETLNRLEGNEGEGVMFLNLAGHGYVTASKEPGGKELWVMVPPDARHQMLNIHGKAIKNDKEFNNACYFAKEAKDRNLDYAEALLTRVLDSHVKNVVFSIDTCYSFAVRNTVDKLVSLRRDDSTNPKKYDTSNFVYMCSASESNEGRILGTQNAGEWYYSWPYTTHLARKLHELSKYKGDVTYLDLFDQFHDSVMENHYARTVPRLAGAFDMRVLGNDRVHREPYLSLVKLITDLEQTILNQALGHKAVKAAQFYRKAVSANILPGKCTMLCVEFQTV